VDREDGRWTYPAFFTVGDGSIGLESGGSGPVVLLIMSNRAMQEFRNGANWSLTRAAGFNVVTYPQTTLASPGRGHDVIVWSGMDRGYSGIRGSLTNIGVNGAYNQAVYGTGYMRRILTGRTPLINQLAIDLRNKLPPELILTARHTNLRRG
jgi:SH3 domain-containing YSC84-like protein 1